MTIHCKDCDNTPMTYVTIDGDTLCGICVNIRYERELNALNEKYYAMVNHAVKDKLNEKENKNEKTN